MTAAKKEPEEESHIGKTVLTVLLFLMIALLAFSFLGIVSLAWVTHLNPAARI